MKRIPQRVAPVLGLVLLAACGGPGTELLQVSQSGFGAFEPSLAAIDGGFAVAWNDNRHGNDEIYLRLLDNALEPVSAELRLTHSPELSYEAALVAFAGQLAVAWYERDPAGHLAVQVGLWKRDGTALWSKGVSSPEFSGRIPVLQALGDKLFIAWVEDAADAAAPSILRGGMLDAAGNWTRAPFAIAAASRTTWNLNADALDDGRVAVVFDAQTETRANELYLALIDETEYDVLQLSADDGFASKYPDLGVHGATAALTWFDLKDGNEEVYLAQVDFRAAGPVDAAPRRITQSAGESVGAYLAWNGDSLGLAWNDNASGQHELFFQAFDASLQPLSVQRQLTQTEAQSLIPAIVRHDDGFALAWNEAVYGSGGHGGDTGTTRSEIFVSAVLGE